jgi:aminoglycoside phosphotransferase (APT) family kinase protein
MVMAIGWLEDGSEESLRAAMAECAPRLAHLPISINAWHAQSNPLWWSSSAVVDERFLVKFAWSEVRAIRLWREGIILERLRALEPSLPTPELIVLSKDPALVVTRRIAGVPLSWDWASGMSAQETTGVARQIAAFLVRLHGADTARVLGDLPEVHPTAQADSGVLRARFPRLVDDGRAELVMRWCDWVDAVLDGGQAAPPVLVHGDLHGYNQVWDPAPASLRAVVDFEESGAADRHFDLRYLPSNARGPELVLAVIGAYERLSEQRLDVERIMAWHVLTALGDGLWRTEAGVALPGGGTAKTYVDDLKVMMQSLGLH